MMDRLVEKEKCILRKQIQHMKEFFRKVCLMIKMAFYKVIHISTKEDFKKVKNREKDV